MEGKGNKASAVRSSTTPIANTMGAVSPLADGNEDLPQHDTSLLSQVVALEGGTGQSGVVSPCSSDGIMDTGALADESDVRPLLTPSEYKAIVSSPLDYANDATKGIETSCLGDGGVLCVQKDLVSGNPLLPSLPLEVGLLG